MPAASASRSPRIATNCLHPCARVHLETQRPSILIAGDRVPNNWPVASQPEILRTRMPPRKPVSPGAIEGKRPRNKTNAHPDPSWLGRICDSLVKLQFANRGIRLWAIRTKLLDEALELRSRFDGTRSLNPPARKDRDRQLMRCPHVEVEGCQTGLQQSQILLRQCL